MIETKNNKMEVNPPKIIMESLFVDGEEFGLIAETIEIKIEAHEKEKIILKVAEAAKLKCCEECGRYHKYVKTIVTKKARNYGNPDSHYPEETAELCEFCATTKGEE